MTFFDVSRTLNEDIAVWPGDTLFSRSINLSRAQGSLVNLSTLTMSAHTGTHIDAPHHVADNATPVDGLDLRPYWGRAQVVSVQKEAGPLLPADLAGFDLRAAPRLLIHSAAGDANPARFLRRFVFPGPQLADYLGRLGIILFGTDAPSVDGPDSDTLAGHIALLKNGIAILEGLDLRAAPDGLYELSALPLKIAGGDGSPVRAVLRQG